LKLLIATLLIITSLTTHASLLKDDLKNGRVSIEQFRMNLAFGWSDTCIKTDDEGYCVQRGETVATLVHHFYTDVFSLNYKTPAGYDANLSCWIEYREPSFYDVQKMRDGVFEIPSDFKEEFRFPYKGDARPSLPQFDFYVKPSFHVVNVQNLYSENKITQRCEGEPNEEVTCWDIRRSTVAFNSNLGSYGIFSFQCSAVANADVPGEQLEITREHFDQMAKDQVRILF
jgi:hypothetical protein